MMIAPPIAIDVPLRADEDGRLLVGDTRATLDSLIGFYRLGESPENLHDGFPTVPLAHIYAVIAYYLANQTEVDAYLVGREAEAERIRQEWEARHPAPSRVELENRVRYIPIK